MNEIKKTTLHPENQPNTDLYPKTSYEQVEGLDGIIAGINTKIDNIPVGGEKVLITVPTGATNGTLTDEQLATLQASEENYIEMVNDKELYYLNDIGHESGFYTYSHVGIENSQATIKTLTITVSAKSFVIVTTVVPTDTGGGKLYRHSIYIEMTGSDGAPASYNGIVMRGFFYSSSNTKMTIDNFKNGDYLGICEIIHAEYNGSIYVPANAYTISSKEDNFIGLFLLKPYDTGSITCYGYGASPTSYTNLTNWTLTDTITEV